MIAAETAAPSTHGRVIAAWTIPRRIESQNKFQWRHWRYYATYRKSWGKVLALIAGRSTCEEFRRVRITSHRVRLLDEGNLVGGAKPIPDALVALGWLVDDSRQWCKVEYVQTRCAKKDERTVIEILEAGE